MGTVVSRGVVVLHGVVVWMDVKESCLRWVVMTRT